MEEITFQVQRDEASGWLEAWWEDPGGGGGITTQAEDPGDLQRQLMEAVVVHFEDMRRRQVSCSPLPDGRGLVGESKPVRKA